MKIAEYEDAKARLLESMANPTQETIAESLNEFTSLLKSEKLKQEEKPIIEMAQALKLELEKSSGYSF